MATLTDLPVGFRSGTHAPKALLRVALLEDSPEEAMAMKALLDTNGMEVSHQSRADAFLEMLRRDSFDALVLDWNVPGLTGYEVLRRVRDDLGLKVPVIMVTARGGEFEVVQALQGGADDYVVKPWRPFELLARLRVLTRAAPQRANGGAEESWAGWSFDTVDRRVTHGALSVQLSRKEFEVARVLFRHLGQPVSREHLNQVVWGGGTQSRTVDTHVSRVRVRLDLSVAQGFQLQAIYGFGYRLDQLQSEAA